MPAQTVEHGLLLRFRPRIMSLLFKFLFQIGNIGEAMNRGRDGRGELESHSA